MVNTPRSDDETTTNVLNLKSMKGDIECNTIDDLEERVNFEVDTVTVVNVSCVDVDIRGGILSYTVRRKKY